MLHNIAFDLELVCSAGSSWSLVFVENLRTPFRSGFGTTIFSASTTVYLVSTFQRFLQFLNSLTFSRQCRVTLPDACLQHQTALGDVRRKCCNFSATSTSVSIATYVSANQQGMRFLDLDLFTNTFSIDNSGCNGQTKNCTVAEGLIGSSFQVWF